MTVNILTEQDVVHGQVVTFYHVPGVGRFSDKREVETRQERREKFFQDMSRSIMKSATFSHKSRPVGQARRRGATESTKQLD